MHVSPSGLLSWYCGMFLGDGGLRKEWSKSCWGVQRSASFRHRHLQQRHVDCNRLCVRLNRLLDYTSNQVSMILSKLKWWAYRLFTKSGRYHFCSRFHCHWNTIKITVMSQWPLQTLVSLEKDISPVHLCVRHCYAGLHYLANITPFYNLDILAIFQLDHFVIKQAALTRHWVRSLFDIIKVW